jgi:hypothetical protein
MSVTKWPRQRGLVIVPRRGSYDDGELTDAHGVAVTQTIQRLYSVS